MNKLLVLIAGLVIAGAGYATTATIRDNSLTVTQTPSRRVIVNYALDNGPAIVTFEVLTNGVSIGGQALTNYTGDINRKLESGSYTFHWLPTKSWPGHVFPAGGDVTVSVKVTAWDVNTPPDVMVIDLVAKSNVTYYASLDSLPGGVTDRLYNTDKLVLRKIPAEYVTWRMGCPTTEPDYNKWVDVSRNVTLTRDYYMGVFEVTQQQWYRITATKPALFTNMNCWATRPVENVAYSDGTYPQYDVRGSTSWPNGADPHAVGATSFFGKLRAHCGLGKLDLPTEAQWEYACRAGSPGPLYNDLAFTAENALTLARYRDNSGYVYGNPVDYASDLSYGPAKVGTYAPNSWGLYDMLGNVAEWCLDLWKDDLSSLSGIDPVGPTSGSYRGFRGGGWPEKRNQLRCGSRSTYSDTLGYAAVPSVNPWDKRNHVGFRVCLHMD